MEHFFLDANLESLTSEQAQQETHCYFIGPISCVFRYIDYRAPCVGEIQLPNQKVTLRAFLRNLNKKNKKTIQLTLNLVGHSNMYRVTTRMRFKLDSVEESSVHAYIAKH